MSWFDATGIASLAKSALKEAQKTIDKALDIKEDDETDGSQACDKLKSSSSTSSISVKSAEQFSPESEQSSDTSLNMIKQSISNPILSTVTTATSASNLWGSFTGSFFDANNPMNTAGNVTAVTIAPTSTSELRSISSKNEEKTSNTSTAASISGRTSSASVSESIELLSPTTPSSNLTSPSANFQQSSSASCITLQHSQTPSDIEVIKPTSSDATPSDIISPESVISTAPAITSASCSSISDSVEIIDNALATFNVPSTSTDEISKRLNDDEEDSVSLSYNTVSESTAPVTILEPKLQKVPITVVQPSRSGLTLNLQPKNVKDQLKVASTSSKQASTATTLEKSLESFDGQTTFSDSTQSFEDVQQILLDEAKKDTKSTLVNDEMLLSPLSADGKNAIESSTLTAIVNTSEHNNSGHTSADEVETATSSDIEIISGPNGDSSSQNSVAGIIVKASPSKFGAGGANSQYVIYGNTSKKKGHYRELSEASTYSMQSESGSDGCSHSASEYEKLAHRINELTEVVEVRELKLVELGRENAQLHEQNNELQHQLEELQSRVDSQGMSAAADDYTQRMSALERKFQQTLRERDNLRVELKSVQATLSKSVSREDIDKLVKEKDMMIDELKTEGEKLSKQILQHSNIIKKLRVKEKESDSLLKRQTEQIEELTSELDRTKKSLSAKDEVERTQMEAVHKLTSEKQKLIKELANVKSELEDVAQKLKTTQTSFEAAKKELTEKQQEHYSLTRKAKNLTTLQSEQQTLQQQNQQLLVELESMREKFKMNAGEQTTQLQNLRQENALLVRRLEEIEQRSEEQAHAVTEATIPLVKQCESLQSTLNTRTIAWEKQEMAYLKKIEKLEKQLANVSINEQTANEQSETANARIENLEETLSKALLRTEQSAIALQQKQVEYELLQSDFKKKQAANDEEIQKYKEKIEELNRSVDELNIQLKDMQDRERQAVLAKPKLSRKISSVEFAESSIEYGGNGSDNSDDREVNQIINNSSPTPSVGRMSANESMASNIWQLEDIDSISNVGTARRTSLSNSLYGNASLPFGGGSALIETLQSSLKQRDGENHQLQWELSRLQSERNFLMSEVSTLTSQLEGIKDKLATHDSVVNQFTELQEQYDAILQMYGEKVEETQELQLDLQDVKDMYRAQIDDLLVQHRHLEKQLLDAQQKGND